MNGRVYVFNFLSDWTLYCAINGPAVNNIPAASTAPTGYTPGQLVVGRVPDMSDAPGHFCNGDNTVNCFWAPYGSYQFRVQIDGEQLPLAQDLLLVVTLNKWFLCDRSGITRSSGDMRKM